MDEKATFSRRTLLKAAVIAVPVAALAVAVPTVLTRTGDVAMWWSSLSQDSDTARATLNVRIPAGVAAATDARIFVNAMAFPVYALTSITANTPWKPFFAPSAPFQLLTAASSTAERSALVVVDFARLLSDGTGGTVRATCNGSDGSVLAEASLDLVESLVTRFS